jgi:rubrerythrin
LFEGASGSCRRGLHSLEIRGGTMRIKGTMTEKNLLAAFAGESQARNRYTYFAGVAKKEGFEQIAAIFLETADNEKEHAKRFFKFLEGGMAEFTATFPAGVIGTTAQNLKAAAEGEHEEWTRLYPGFAEIADQEGFRDVAAAFRFVSKVEVEHEKRYRKLLKNLESGNVFKRSGKNTWICRNCGHHHEGLEAPEQCPTCLHPKSFFELWMENY